LENKSLIKNKKVIDSIKEYLKTGKSDYYEKLRSSSCL